MTCDNFEVDMDKLIEYINSLSIADRTAFEKEIKTTINYLRRANSGKTKLGINICIAIDKATDGIVRCEDIRPDIDWRFLRSPQEA